MSTSADTLGGAMPAGVTVFTETGREGREVQVATEVPLTIMANDIEVATLACTPADLDELVRGFLFTSGFARSAADIRALRFDTSRWVAEASLSVAPDPALMTRRLYTAGCGKGVQFPGIVELSMRTPLAGGFCVAAEHVRSLARWLQGSSPLHGATGGVHTAALSTAGALPDRAYDDIGRHNAVDKAIGRGLCEQADFTRCVLLTTGRVSSEILFKARRAGVPVLVSLGAPTHQAVLLARQTNLTLVGFARGRTFTVYASPERICP